MTRSEQTAEFTVALRRDVVLRTEGDKVRLGLANGMSAQLSGVSAESHEAIASIRTGLHTADELPSAVLTKIEPFLAIGVRLDGRLAAVLERTGATGLLPALPELSASSWLRLGRFSLVRRRDMDLVLESPLSKYRAVLLAPALFATFAVAGPVPGTALWPLLSLLAGAGFLDVGVDGEFAAETAVLRQWDVHDLYFHSRSRRGRTDEPFGGQFQHAGQIEPLPAVKPAPQGPLITLHRPDFDEVRAADLGLQEAIEARQSIRAYGTDPITVDQLGEFLYRTARVRGTLGLGPGLPYEVSSRPYPGGGAEYELELYLTVRRCSRLEPGIYHYDPADHALRLINTGEPDRNALLRVASLAAGGRTVPDVLITMTSRFQRLAWKYRSIAYALTLKHVGVLCQTMYLVTTSMGLAGCALGIGDSDVAARAFGLDYLAESSVGEFILGSAPAEVPAPVLADSWQSEAIASR